ncbi:hypothetical protein FUAX_30060 [Fulvitalea axinellae]|uniref:FAS1 domain-containing protein n=1 Tax=Fulvitalea axinellae TaxID=1182444 RepID=A0AAU9CEI1_9BACT|nr:hypothetical protein FUAX_30060 [Fulvitalea axinellae]
MKIFKQIGSGLLFAVLLGLAACSDFEDHYTKEGDSVDKTVGEYLASNAEYAQFAELVKTHGYMDSISGVRPVTLFLPPKGSLEGLSVPADSMAKIVSYHIGNSLLYDYMLEGDEDLWVKSLYDGKNIWASKKGGSLGFDRTVRLGAKPVHCSNGVVYTLDAPLLPQRNIFQNVWAQTEGYEAYKEMVLDDSLLFDIKNSFPLGVDELGRTVYDSAFMLDYIFLRNVGDINDEDRKYGSLLYSDKMLEATFDRMVKRYYGEASNLPEFLKDEENVEKVLTQILRSSLIAEDTETLVLGDTLTTTTGRKILITQEWLDRPGKKLSNGFVHELTDVDFLSSPLMGRSIIEDGSLDEHLYFDSGDEEVEFGRDKFGGDFFGTFVSEKPFWFEYRIPELMAGFYSLSVKGWGPESTQAIVYVDGKEVTTHYNPAEDGTLVFFPDIKFGTFGEKTVRFEVNVPDDEGKYKMAIGNMVFMPVQE